jgi:Acyl-CoA carboxylase epsilon subunit
MAENVRAAANGQTDHPEGEPFLRVICGNPTPEEIAALLIVLMDGASEASARPVRRRRSAWADAARPHYPQLRRET